MNDNVVFSGSLLFVPMADLFQLLGSNNCTGILTLRSPHAADMGVVYFMNGNPVNATYGNLTGLKAVHALFGWTNGKYEFSEEQLTGIDTVIKQGNMGIVLDALRLLDDGEIAKVGPDVLPVKEEKISPDGTKTEFVRLVKGPLLDFRYVTGEYSYPDGATIVKEGKYGNWLWVIYQGTVRITRETAKGTVTLARLGEGCFIGNIRSLLYGEIERNATATAEGNVTLCILDGESLRREFSALPPDFRNLLISLNSRLRLISDSAVRAYEGTFPKALSTDKVLDDQFQNTKDLYIIRKGTADIIGKGPGGPVSLISLGTDDVFGKLPFLDFGHEPSNALIMTSNPFQADVLDSEAFQKEYDQLSHTLRNFVFDAATHISMTTKLFYHLLDKP